VITRPNHPSERKSEFEIAGRTPEGVGASRAMSGALDWGSRFTFDPAPGTLQIRPDYRDKAAKALMREVRRAKLLLKLRLLGLYFRKLALDLRSAILLGESYFACKFRKLSSQRRHWRISRTTLWNRVCVNSGLLPSPGYSPF
jgi:hypothetical protein